MEYENVVVIMLVILVGIILLCYLFDVFLDFMGKGEEIRLMGIYILLFFSLVLNFCIVIWCN